MDRASRLIDIIQLLRRAKKPLTAEAIAAALEVTKRTVYRDIVALQAMRAPIDGQAGVGYVMRPGFDLPPLTFTADEVEAVVVGLSLVRRTRDAGLLKAARGVARKIAAAIPESPDIRLDGDALQVSPWSAVPASTIDFDVIRKAIREARKLRLRYEDAQSRGTERTIRPIALVYYVDNVILAAWCELRDGFRHFRADRIKDCAATGDRFKGEADALRAAWRAQIELFSASFLNGDRHPPP
jgi:predicted DNA-binding transcriptional regulator YafY